MIKNIELLGSCFDHTFDFKRQVTVLLGSGADVNKKNSRGFGIIEWIQMKPELGLQGVVDVYLNGRKTKSTDSSVLDL